MTKLCELFSDEAFGFRLKLRRGSLAEFFSPSEAHSRIIAERRRWLEAAPENYLAESKLSPALWSELAATIKQPIDPSDDRMALTAGSTLEPDIVFLQRDATGKFRLTDGVVVFPTGWALPEKIGLTLAETHGVVPGLNAMIGDAIDRFLDQLKPGVAATRSNWGLAATNELNLHPSVNRPRLDDNVTPDQVWLRVEHQILALLPHTDAIVFGIRIELIPLSEVLTEPDARSRLHRALDTMPATVARYKGLAQAMPSLLRMTSLN